MITSRPSSAPRRPRTPGKAVWVAARMVLLMLMATAAWARQMAPGKARNSVLRFAAVRTRWLEHIFRCLLIVLRARPAAPKPAPFVVSHTLPAGGRTRRPRRASKQFSLSLWSLARGFEQAGKADPLLEAWKARQSRARPVARPVPALPGPAACPVDPAALLGARLAALKAVLDDPYPHAARMAAILKAAGLCARRLKPMIPNGEIWAFLNHTAARAPAGPSSGLRADTS
ncbi:hypothetical protein ACQKH5_05840 [Hyphomonas sp. NPDC076900]|uniref:hypothetical protein n=1 Tax=unclassified Hyphomonas TaxID=2630699 RepID=UPI003CFD577C